MLPVSNSVINVVPVGVLAVSPLSETLKMETVQCSSVVNVCTGSQETCLGNTCVEQRLQTSEVIEQSLKSDTATDDIFGIMAMETCVKVCCTSCGKKSGAATADHSQSTLFLLGGYCVDSCVIEAGETLCGTKTTVKDSEALATMSLQSNCIAENCMGKCLQSLDS